MSQECEQSKEMKERSDVTVFKRLRLWIRYFLPFLVFELHHKFAMDNGSQVNAN